MHQILIKTIGKSPFDRHLRDICSVFVRKNSNERRTIGAQSIFKAQIIVGSDK